MVSACSSVYTSIIEMETFGYKSWRKQEMKRCHLAVDIGASSGRHIIGELVDGRMKLTEVYRFENGLVEKNGHLCWDIDKLAESVIEGMKAAAAAGYQPQTMGIDTWAVDFVLLDRDNRRIGDAVAYRDARTDGVRDKLDRLAAEGGGGVDFAHQYARTGIQYLQFNTCYQLAALRREHPEQLEQAAAFLMIPDYLNWRLTGVMANEYTNATTTALVNAESRDWDDELIRAYDLPRGIFQQIRMPGTELEHLLPTVRQEAGFDCRVLLPATHDTGSAFLAVPAEDNRSLFLSSGTWSLMGVENPAPITTAESREANFTNEGGYEYRFRYLRNIMGLWMIQSVRRELGTRLGKKPSFQELIARAEECTDFDVTVEADDPRFLAPASMLNEVAAAAAEQRPALSGRPGDRETGTCLTVGETMQTIYNSLTADYARTAAGLAALTGRTFAALHIVGGGSQDQYLNQRTADATGLPVYAGPTEGTALGNLIAQWIADDELKDLGEARKTIRDSFPIQEFMPR